MSAIPLNAIREAAINIRECLEDNTTCMCDVENIISKAIDKHEVEQWISAKERLPDKNSEQWFIVSNGLNSFPALWWVNFWGTEEGIKHKNIKRWRTLPQPPKEEL